MDPHPPRPSTNRSRRELLKTAGIALASGLTTSISGCLSGLPPLGQRQSYGRVDVPPATEPVYRSWLPAPSAFDEPSHHYQVRYAEPDRIDGTEPKEFIGRRARAKTNLDYFGVGFEQYDSYLDSKFGTVIEADFEVQTVTDTLSRSGYELSKSYRGFNLYSHTDGLRRAAVRDSTILWSSRRVHEHPALEALIETEAGERARYHESNRDFNRISTATGSSRQVVLGPNFGNLTEKAELAAIGFRFAGDEIYQVINLLYPQGSVPSVEAFEQEMQERRAWMSEGVDGFDSKIGNRIASIEARIPRQDAHLPRHIANPPQATWGASHDADDEKITIRHEVGEAVDANLLWADIYAESIRAQIVDPSTQTSDTASERTTTRPGSVVTSLWEEGGMVSPGDIDTINLRSLDLAPNSGSDVSPRTSDNSSRIDLETVSRVDVVLAEHRGHSVSDWYRLFSYEVE